MVKIKQQKFNGNFCVITLVAYLFSKQSVNLLSLRISKCEQESMARLSTMVGTSI